ncbi:MAG: hypothetical protein ACOX7K_09245 [Oscillospiraceae bacterium]|jgi:hypothetical protein
MKRHIQIVLIVLILVNMLASHASAITTGRWDLDSAKRYVNSVASEMIQQNLETAYNMPDGQTKAFQDAIAEQIAAAKVFWMQRR